MQTPSVQIGEYLDEVGALLYRLPRQPIQDIIDALLTAYHQGRTVFVVGNGGSAATASHFACDLQKWTLTPGKAPFKALALTDNMAVFSAWANDNGYEHVFEAQLHALLSPGDVVVAISGSGNSPNVLRAVDYAAAAGAVTVGLTGFSGGALAERVAYCVTVPSNRMNQIEDVHMTLCHLVADVVRTTLSAVDPNLEWVPQRQPMLTIQTVH